MAHKYSYVGLVGTGCHFLFFAMLLGVGSVCIAQDESKSAGQTTVDILRSAAAKGKIVYRLTTPEELQAILGKPTGERTSRDGEMDSLILQYSNAEAEFVKMSNQSRPFTLIRLVAGGERIDIGSGRQIVLRNEDDLKKLDSFWGLEGISLEKLDLRSHLKLLGTLPFDSRTIWPTADRMPEGFDPASILEEGKNPGLGVQKLHKEGIDGRGVGIAIIDQPLLRDHFEYKDRIVHLEQVDVNAVPTWKWQNCKPYCDVIDKIIELGASKGVTEKIRVVSISEGMFSAWKDYALWKQTLDKSAKNGILVVTCDHAVLDYGMLARTTDSDFNEPSSYHRGRYSGHSDILLVPGGTRTRASQVGIKSYAYDREGGVSWGAPYLAGLAALAYQVNPEIKPDEIVKLWVETAVKTEAGPVVNPPGFIDAVQKIRAQ